MDQTTGLDAPPAPAETPHARSRSPRAARLRRRLYLAAIAGVAAVPILLLAAALAYDGIARRRAALEEGLWRASRDALAAVDKVLGNELAALEAMSAFLESEDGELAALYGGAATRVRDRHGWNRVRLIDPHTLRVVAAIGGDDGGGPTVLADRVQVETVARAERSSATVLPREQAATAGALPDVVLRVPVWRDERVDRVLTASVGAGALGVILARTDLPPAWTAAVIDPAFRIAARNRAAEAYVGTPVTASLRAEIERANEGFFFAANKEGQRVYTMFTRSPVTGWTVAIGAPAAVVEGPLLWSKLGFAGAGGGAVLIAGLLAFHLVRNFERRQNAEERLAAVAAEADAEDRLAEIARNLPGVVYRRVLHLDGTVSYPFISGGVADLFAASGEELRRPMAIADIDRAVRFERGEELREALLRSARDLSPYEVEGPVALPGGERRWIRSMAVPRRRQSDGAVVWDGVILDVTEEKRADEQRDMLMAELDHRVRNILAVVQGLASLSLPRGDEATETYRGRLRALAHAHGLLAETSWVGAGLRRLVEAELAPYRGGGRVVLSGEEFVLPPAAAQAMVLAVHELTTNAAKHGALSRPGGRVEVTWAAVPSPGGRDRGAAADGEGGEPRLALVWAETGGPPVPEPGQQGFGHLLIERNIRHSLGGRVALAFRPEGLRCEILFPLRREASLAAAATRAAVEPAEA